MATAYITAPPEDAGDIARLLVEERLAACVNRIPCESTYRWKGELIDEEEEILLAKTTEERYPDLLERVLAAHPYDVPCVERFDEGDVFPDFGQWRDDAVEH